MEEKKQNNLEVDEHSAQDSQSPTSISILCPLCNDYIAKSQITACGHSYCKICIQEYMLFLDECTVCKQSIREQKHNSNMVLDTFIKQYIRKEEPGDLKEFQNRLQTTKQYELKRQTKELWAGDMIDVRDTDYVWCTGIIVRTVNKWQDKRVKYAIVKLKETARKQEFIETSNRLAAHGFYTSRTDIPRYVKGVLVYQNHKMIKKVPYMGSDQQLEDSDQ